MGLGFFRGAARHLDDEETSDYVKDCQNLYLDQTRTHMSTDVLDKGKQKAVEGDFVALEQDDDASTSPSDSDSDSDSNSSTSTDDMSDSDTEDEVTPEYLQSLLDKARRNAREEVRRVRMLQEEKEMDAFGEKDIIKIGDGEEEKEEKYVREGVVIDVDI